MDYFAELQAGNWISEKYADHFRSVKDRVVISLSFFGLDKAALLPPNYHLTGPLIRPPSETKNEFEPKL